MASFVWLFCHLLAPGLGKRGAVHSGLVVVEALDFGLHVLEAGLFGGKGGFVWFCFGFEDVGFDWRRRFGFLSGRFEWRDGFVWGEALGL